MKLATETFCEPQPLSGGRAMALQSTAAASVWIKADANGKAYYWRSDTREVRWDRPPPARKMAMSPL